MAIFTASPIEVAPDPFLWINDGAAGGGKNGPFSFGGNLYIVGYQQASIMAAVAKSTDGGSTWTVFNQSTGPEEWNDESTQFILDAANSNLVFFANDSFTGNLFCFEFDLIGESFSSNTDSGIVAASSDLNLVQRPNGDVVGLYSKFATPRELMGVVIAGNAFGTPFTIDAGSGSEQLIPRASVAASDNVIHIAYEDSTAAPLLYITLDASNTPGTRQTIDALAPGLVSNGLISVGFDQLLFLGQVFSGIPILYVGTPISAPVWTSVPLHAATPTLDDQEVYAVDAGGSFKLFYFRKDSPQTILELMQVIWDGSTMGTPEVFWDVVANPPPGAIGIPVTDLATDGVTGAQIGSTLALAVTAVIDASDNYSAVYLSIGGAALSGYLNIWY